MCSRAGTRGWDILLHQCITVWGRRLGHKSCTSRSVFGTMSFFCRLTSSRSPRTLTGSCFLSLSCSRLFGSSKLSFSVSSPLVFHSCWTRCLLFLRRPCPARPTRLVEAIKASQRIRVAPVKARQKKVQQSRGLLLRRQDSHLVPPALPCPGEERKEEEVEGQGRQHRGLRRLWQRHGCSKPSTLR